MYPESATMLRTKLPKSSYWLLLFRGRQQREPVNHGAAPVRSSPQVCDPELVPHPAHVIAGH